MTELRGQGFSDMVDHYFANEEQHMTEAMFINAILKEWEKGSFTASLAHRTAARGRPCCAEHQNPDPESACPALASV